MLFLVLISLFKGPGAQLSAFVNICLYCSFVGYRQRDYIVFMRTKKENTGVKTNKKKQEKCYYGKNAHHVFLNVPTFLSKSWELLEEALLLLHSLVVTATQQKNEAQSSSDETRGEDGRWDFSCQNALVLQETCALLCPLRMSELILFFFL